MPDDRKNKPGMGRKSCTLALVTAALLAGCVNGNGSEASRSAASVSDPAIAGTIAPSLGRKGAVDSAVITDLRQRRSILPPGSAFAQVAASVLAAGAGTAEAELRVSRLTAKAKSKNWLPSIGPSLSLNSLGTMAASLLLDQAIMDNGYRKAERAFAAADVEVMAVSLASDLNQRVYEGLKYYVEAQHAAELASLTDTALVRMRDFERIVSIRVEGGLSDRSEFRVISQKRSEMEAILSQEREAVATAKAELAAMSQGGLDGISGVTTLPTDSGVPEPLSVLYARGDAWRTRAEIKMVRAGLKPGFGATASIDADGNTDAGLSIDGEGLGFGRKDNLKALEEAEVVASRKVDEAVETANRRIVSLEREIVSLTAEQAQQNAVLQQMSGNLDLFTEQYKVGRRSLLELVGQFETYAGMQRESASLKYQIILARLEIAKERGVLVDGAAM